MQRGRQPVGKPIAHTVSCKSAPRAADVVVNISAPIVDYGTTLAYPHAFTISPLEEREKWELPKETCLHYARIERDSQPFIERLNKMGNLDAVEDRYAHGANGKRLGLGGDERCSVVCPTCPHVGAAMSADSVFSGAELG